MTVLTLQLGLYPYFISAYHGIKKMSIEYSAKDQYIGRVWEYNPYKL